MRYTVKSASSKVWIMVLVVLVIGIFAAIKAFGPTQQVITNTPSVTNAPVVVATVAPVVTVAPTQLATGETDTEVSIEPSATEEITSQMSTEDFLALAQKNPLHHAINLHTEGDGEFKHVDLIDFDIRKNDEVMVARQATKFIVYNDDAEVVEKVQGKKGSTSWKNGYLENVMFSKLSVRKDGTYSDEQLVTVGKYLDSTYVECGYWFEGEELIYGVRFIGKVRKTTNGGSSNSTASSQPTQAPSQPTQAPSQPTQAPSQPTEAPTVPTATFTIPTAAPVVPEATFTIPDSEPEPEPEPIHESTDFTIGNGNQTLGNENMVADFMVGGSDTGNVAGFTIGQ